MGMVPKSILGIILVITLLNTVHCSQKKQPAYPTVRRDEKVVDAYHGTKVKDPYRWLEQPDSSSVSGFVGDQNEFSQNYLSTCEQPRQFRERLSELWAYPKFGRPEKRGSRYFYFAQQRGGEVLYVQEEKGTSPRPLIDPQENGVLSFPSFGVSRDGAIVVYREVVLVDNFPRSTGNLRLLNINGSVYPDVLKEILNPQVAWDRHSRGFFYFSHRKLNGSDDSESEEDEDPPNFYIRYHKVGSRSEADVVAIEYADFKEEPDFVDMEISADGHYLLLRTKTRSGTPGAQKTNNIFYVANLKAFEESAAAPEKLQLVPVVSKRNSAFVKYITNIGTLFYFKNRVGNKNYNLIELDLSNPAEDAWREVIGENPNYILQTATAVDKSKVVLSYTSKKLNSYAELRDLRNGSLIRMFPLEFGELLSFSGHIDDSEVLFRSTKLEGLPELFYLDVRDPRGPMKRLVQQPKLSHYDPSQFVTEVVTFPSTDGEKVEMILMHKRDFKRDGSAFAFIVEREFDLDFYFRVYLSYMKDFNAVVAFPHLEGNGGFRDSSLDDFLAATDYLVEHAYSSTPKIIARGKGTFGLFVAAAANKRPDLFAAVIPIGAAFDMLRFDAVVNGSAGLGTTEDVESFKRTYGISPLHNIRFPANESVQYPAIFIPASNEYPIPLAYKYISELQHTLGSEPRQTNPFILRVIPEPHDPSAVEIFARYHIDRETDIRCFLELTVGLRVIE